ncbi:MAG: aspartate/tyrosine/aromatic aminotransferase [Candidatus Hydrogenedentes bacterium]|nr:aspartate/tyrosine/aromatic aminotransferase [Candidatus Hydrogenedentota bacterium]
MFNTLEMAPPDAILGLTEAFKSDPNPQKINLGVGIYKDDAGQTPVLSSVKKAEAKLLDTESTKSYLGIPGSPQYAACVQDLLFGAGSAIITEKRAVSAHTPGGTGGLRVAADFIFQQLPSKRIWVSDPTWANHPAIFQAAGLEVSAYPYYDAPNKALAFDAMMDALKQVPAGDVVLFHGCCHNPTGLDPLPAQWQALAALAKERGFLPFFDFAYQGFAQGLEEDAAGLRAFCAVVPELIVCSSFSKNFGLYNERVGAITVLAETAEAAAKAFSQVQRSIRANYSNPPSHGGAIVTSILTDPALRAEWEEELRAMRVRIAAMRTLFVETLKAKGVTQDFSFIADQIGMFSFSGLTGEQVARLRKEYAIYIVGSGRISVAGMTRHNMDKLCTAIAAVL